MKKLLLPAVLLSALLVLTGCSDPAFRSLFGMPTPEVVPAALPAPVPPPVETLDPTPPPPPPPAARTVEEFDTTSAEDRAAAVAAPAPASEVELGTTIASLGSPTEPGIWLRTGLVTELAQGRVEYMGKSVNLELRPSGGEASAGSQISLAAMRLLEAPLTGLPELTVFR